MANVKRQRVARPKNEATEGAQAPKFLQSENDEEKIPLPEQDATGVKAVVKKEAIEDGAVKEGSDEDIKVPGLLDDKFDIESEIKARNKKLAYALGTTPFPNHKLPTPYDVEEVVALLTLAHGPAIRPDKVPKPDNSVSGCGEVPSVLDAVIRTLLSANTANSNSSKAFAGLVERFGLVPECAEAEGVRGRSDAGTVNWDAVRRADLDDLVKSIRQGGMAPTKGRRIKNLLDVVWKESIDRKRAERIKEEASIKQEDGIKQEGAIKKEPVDDEDYNVDDEDGDLSLDYIHELSDDEAREKLTSFDGVGPKTASCVMLFCLQRDSFAVDTHVFRLSKFLKWVPQKATRETTYAHLDVRVPAEHKYALHNLLIRHGRTCKECKAGPKHKGKKRASTEASLDDSTEAGPKMRKVWIGTGMMKEILVEVPDIGQEGDAQSQKCALRALLKRQRDEKAKAKLGAGGGAGEGSCDAVKTKPKGECGEADIPIEDIMEE
ncbi:DNA glycosylase [Choiromyces venosus 120613-1]|uniref:DNA glycosylase n=1 Tax=Choiromyces venosus 120613-1 TaxID=1336337 RepID=A0A3N4JII1_9PEZI|nr:DNA glycosylase [Choiromyces venosus 120613-1]